MRLLPCSSVRRLARRSASASAALACSRRARASARLASACARTARWSSSMSRATTWLESTAIPFLHQDGGQAAGRAGGDRGLVPRLDVAVGGEDRAARVSAGVPPPTRTGATFTFAGRSRIIRTTTTSTIPPEARTASGAGAWCGDGRSSVDPQLPRSAVPAGRRRSSANLLSGCGSVGGVDAPTAARGRTAACPVGSAPIPSARTGRRSPGPAPARRRSRPAA